MSEAPADTIVILSTELIERITEQYFNKTMFKQAVRVMDSKPHGDAGYMFSVAFVPSVKKGMEQQVVPQIWGADDELKGTTVDVPIRGDNGRFVSASASKKG